MSETLAKNGLILVTGATGYVGSRLVPLLLENGYRVRCMVRDVSRARDRDWSDRVELVQGDALDAASLGRALEGVDVAYYLIHGMHGGRDFEDRDRQAARHFASAAEAANVRRIIYLGGLGAEDTGLSPHLRSRQDVGELLASTGVPVTEFRASIIVGSGSLSFEMIRYLVERIPVMVCPKWVYRKVQPIAVADVLDYLVQALQVPECAGRVVEIGGADVLTYGEMMKEYARERGLRRLLIPVPFLTPRLSSYWVHWTTPIPSSIVRPLIEGLKNDTIVKEPGARELFPAIWPRGYRHAVSEALQALEVQNVESSWSDALSSTRSRSGVVALRDREGLIVERRVRHIRASTAAVHDTVASLGGENGWFVANWSWRLRGALDRLFGGVGFRRGRRSPTHLRVGDALDFWRVEAVERGRLLRLRAEMKLPGRAWLEFEVQPSGEGESHLEQRAYFAPRGLPGHLYWYLLYPMHALIFRGLVREIGARAETLQNTLQSERSVRHDSRFA